MNSRTQWTKQAAKIALAKNRADVDRSFNHAQFLCNLCKYLQRKFQSVVLTHVYALQYVN